MKKINTLPIVGSLGMSAQSGIIEHQQNSLIELIEKCLQTIAGKELSVGTLYVLYGCVISGSNPYSITAGAVAYNDGTHGTEIFFVPAVTNVTLTGSNVFVANIITSQYTAVDAGSFKKGDPVTFSDNSTHNVLDIRNVNWGQGLTGTGFSGSAATDFNNSNFITFNDPWHVIGAASEPPFQTGWSSGTFGLKFRRIGNIGYLSGQAVFATGGTSTICVIPYVPILTWNIFTVMINGGPNSTIGALDVTGFVTLLGYTPVNGDTYTFSTSFPLT